MLLVLQHTTSWYSLTAAAAAAAKSLQSCPTLCDPIDSSPPAPPSLGFSRPRTLEWVAISFSNAWKWKVKVKSLSRVWLLATPWTAAHQASPSMGFSRQEYQSGVPLPSPALNTIGKNNNNISQYLLKHYSILNVMGWIDPPPTINSFVGVLNTQRLRAWPYLENMSLQRESI